MTPSPIPADEFLKGLRASGLLFPAEVVAAVSAVPAEDRKHSPALAAALVRSGALTSFQARKLLAGASQGMVLGPYRILAMLGRGGMGKVYLARDVRFARPVALKVLPPHKAREEERLLTRFRREMDLAHALDHFGVAGAYETGVAGDVHYIALEYVPGKTLSKIVAQNGPLSPEVAARIFVEAADGLAHAHERGLIHRDLKPSNIMITPAGHAKLLDLGLALRPGETGDASVIGGPGYVVGTMDYVAPEQTRDAAAVDARSDLYGLGATLFFALTGRPPFPGGTSKDKIGRHRREEPPRVDEYNSDVPEKMANLIDELLSKNPEDRPASAAVVRDRLAVWAASPAAPDLPADIPKILASLSAEPAPEADASSTAPAAFRFNSLWLIISGAIVLAIALVVLLMQMLRE